MCKTVTYEGKQYQLGALYEFSDSGEYWSAYILEEIYDTTCPFTANGIGYRHIRVPQCDIVTGTITDAPVVPEVGKVYMCDCMYKRGPEGSSWTQRPYLYTENGWDEDFYLEIKPLYELVRK